MKSIKSLALVVAAIALFPTASLAQNVSGTTQTTTLDSVTIGDHNVTVQETDQRIIDLKKSRQKGKGGNVSGTSQIMNANSQKVGQGNIDIQRGSQEVISGQESK